MKAKLEEEGGAEEEREQISEIKCVAATMSFSLPPLQVGTF